MPLQRAVSLDRNPPPARRLPLRAHHTCRLPAHRLAQPATYNLAASSATVKYRIASGTTSKLVRLRCPAAVPRGAPVPSRLC